jgi:hypothetical protein
MKKISAVFPVLLVLLNSCDYIDINRAEKLSVSIMVSIQRNNWDYIWDNSSVHFKKTYPEYRFNNLKKWVNAEFGKIKVYKKMLLYSGSGIFIPDENYVKVTYDVQYAKGIGQVEMMIIREDGKYKVLKLDFTKKPQL